MRTIIKQLSLCALLLCSAASVRAQQTATSSRVLVAPGVEFFVPNWQIDIQTGGAYDLGEGKFVDLLCKFSFTNTNEMKKTKIVPGIKFHKKEQKKHAK